jgi:hypothetical protein
MIDSKSGRAGARSFKPQSNDSFDCFDAFDVVTPIFFMWRWRL